MYKRILVPLDGSEMSECSLGHLKTLVMGCNDVKIVFLNVVEPFHLAAAVRDEIGEEAVKSIREKNRERILQYLAEKAEGWESAGISVETVVLNGNAAKTILEYSKDNDIDVIVMSTHGSTGLVRFMLGSVADKVIRHSTAPVLLIAPSSCRLPMGG